MVVISENVSLCKTIFKKGTGLMFRRKKKDFAYIFPFKKSKKLSITMWFVFFPIDILFLDKDDFVVEKVENLKSWRFYFPLRKSVTFIELPSGTIKKHSISLAQKIKWDSKSVKIL
ncbi:MAG: DUF192 domain-containing protein [Patescibacteria group bacterium]|nr:DUF192 domain-containing protein [Patescibacteria group bacterium]